MTDMAATLAPPPAASAAGFGHRLAPPGDPLEGAPFDALYEKSIEPELAVCEGERQKALTIFIGAVAVGAVAVLAEYLFFHNFQIMLMTGFAFGVIGYMPLRSVGQKAKVGVISALCGPLNITYQPSCDGPDFDAFRRYNLLPSASDKTFEDYFTGRRGSVEFALYEAILHQGSGKNRTLVFQGQLFRITTPRKLLATTVVLKNSGWLNMFECPAGLQKVGLEDPEFQKIWQVFGSDQVEAREILTPSFMQELVNLEAGFVGKHLRCAFVGPDLFIALEHGEQFDIGNMFTTLVDRARVEGIARNLEQVFKVIDEFGGA
ncbi:MAG: DUF3137 domain-containing protein [Caulobacterales bacterium]